MASNSAETPLIPQPQPKRQTEIELSLRGVKADKEKGIEREDKLHDFIHYNRTYDRPLDYYPRRSRVFRQRVFRKDYKFVQGVKYCVDSTKTYPPVFGDCFLSPWVAFHGINTVCMVTSQNMDMTRLPENDQRDFLYHQHKKSFAKSVISEVECIPHTFPDDELKKWTDMSWADMSWAESFRGLKKPFVVVSVPNPSCIAPETEPKLCRSLLIVRRNIPFFIELMSLCTKMAPLDTHYETIRAALGAYLALYSRGVEAEDIWVTVMDEYGRFDHLCIDIIREQLGILRGDYSHTDAPDTPLFQTLRPRKLASLRATTPSDNKHSNVHSRMEALN